MTSEDKEASKKLNESEMEEFIIDRWKSAQEIETQIGRLEGKFQELEQIRFRCQKKMGFVSLRVCVIDRVEVMILWKWKFRQL